MSDDTKDKALEQAYKCPICEGIDAEPTLPGEYFFALGIVIRDVIPMEKIAPALCNKHALLITKYFETMITLSSAYYGETPVEAEIKSSPKDMN
jgi:hypothetical protein